MKIFGSKDIESFDPVYRLHFINSITGYKSANLIGTKSGSGVSNVAVFSSVTHMGSHPPIVGFFVKPGEDPPDTYKNILETKSYTINHISSEITPKAHQTSANYSSSDSEFQKVGLDEEYTDSVYAPYVKTCRVKFGVEYRDHYLIPINQTVLIVGEIVEIILSESYIQEDGHIDLNRTETVTVSGLDAYHKPSLIERYGYAKVSEEDKKVSQS